MRHRILSHPEVARPHPTARAQRRAETCMYFDVCVRQGVGDVIVSRAGRVQGYPPKRHATVATAKHTRLPTRPPSPHHLITLAALAARAAAVGGTAALRCCTCAIQPASAARPYAERREVVPYIHGGMTASAVGCSGHRHLNTRSKLNSALPGPLQPTNANHTHLLRTGAVRALCALGCRLLPAHLPDPPLQGGRLARLASAVALGTAPGVFLAAA